MNDKAIAAASVADHRRRWILAAARLALLAGLVAWIASQISFAEVAERARGLEGSLIAGAAVLILLSPLLTVVRWDLLLGTSGIRLGFWTACRLTYVGLFFNLVVPGLTGGDVVKAVLVARRAARREAAVLSVFADRILGILALALLAGLVLLPSLRDFADLAAGLYGLLALLLAGGALLLSRRLRRATRMDRWIRRLPFERVVARLDEAILAYRAHPGVLAASLFLSIGNHLAILAAVVAIARAIGDPLPLSHLLVLVPVINIASSVPIAPGGWVVGESLFGTLFARYGSTLESGVAVSLLFRLCLMATAIPGGLFWLLGERRRAGALAAADSPPTR
jgi:hypothetical protein